MQCRDEDKDTASILKKINHLETYKRAHAERNILKILEGDCETAIGAHSKINGDHNYFRSRTFFLRWLT